MSKVYLIGAGPGQEELISVKAVRALKKCTAVLYDRLVGPGILKYLNEECEVYYCGKKPGCHYKTQEEINAMLVKLAKEGYIVGRIKGGDPYVFGRGGEEALELIKEKIEFEVVPGITSPISALNYAGIPITHRGIAQSFHVFTGKSADKLNINWKSVASIGGTLVFLMGYENLDLITKSLIKNGMNETTPCAVVMMGTTSKQKKAIGTLMDIVDKSKEKELMSPCIIAVGNVVNFNNRLNWYENKPLFGKNICITRGKEQSKEIRERLLDLGAEVTEVNSIKIMKIEEALDNYIDKLGDYNYIVFTSVNSVNIFFEYLQKKEYDIRNIKGEFAAIGEATYNAIKSKGIISKIMGDSFVAESLFQALETKVKRGDKILIPRSKNAREFLVQALKGVGCEVDEVHIYETACGEISNSINVTNIDMFVFTSPTTVKNTIKLIGKENLLNKDVLSIGPITSEELRKNEINHVICDEYSMEGIIEKAIQISKQKER